MKILTAEKEGYTVSTDKTRLDLRVIHGFLSREAYWSKGIPLERVLVSIDNSLNFGLYVGGRQIGYARIISDYSTIAYLGDVFILPEYRGRGLSRWLLSQVMSHPELQGLRRWILLTKDAHELYRELGWKDIAAPEKWMELHHADPYGGQAGGH